MSMEHAIRSWLSHAQSQTSPRFCPSKRSLFILIPSSRLALAWHFVPDTRRDEDESV